MKIGIRSIFVFFMVLVLISATCIKVPPKKIPISTSSKEAKEAYLKALALQDNLKGTEALVYFQEAVEKDPRFARAHYNLALSQPTNKGFFKSLNKAVALADQVSEGERLLILSLEAGANGQTEKQKELVEKLAAAYPKDERAHMQLGNFYFGTQAYDKAVEVYEKIMTLAPSFAPVYNQLGYSHRFMGDFSAAEKAFKKYIELIPDNPNPYDSYAELLLKMGKYDASIESYQKALQVDPYFIASVVGIATNLNLKGEYAKARENLDAHYANARNDGERRALLFAKAVSFADEDDLKSALFEIRKQYALAEVIDDASAMSGDLFTMGTLYREMRKYKEAVSAFNQALDIVAPTSLSDMVKANTRLGVTYNLGLIDLEDGHMQDAKMKAVAFLDEAEQNANINQIRLANQLVGLIAMREKRYNDAIEALEKANLQNPYNLYYMAVALAKKGDDEAAAEWAEKAAHHNTLNSLNYALCRHKAEKLL